jgi:hypothetical protein
VSTTCTKRQVEHGHQSGKAIILLENNIRNKSRGLWVVNQLRIRLLSIVNQQNVTEVMANVDIYRVAAISGEKSVHPSADGTSKRPPIRCHFCSRSHSGLSHFSFGRQFVKSASTARGFPHHLWSSA